MHITCPVSLASGFRVGQERLRDVMEIGQAVPLTMSEYGSAKFQPISARLPSGDPYTKRAVLHRISSIRIG